jgi:hypothetical protein
MKYDIVDIPFVHTLSSQRNIAGEMMGWRTRTPITSFSSHSRSSRSGDLDVSS